MFELLTALAFGGLVAYLAYDQMWLWQKASEAKAVSCPVCGSQDVEGVTEDDLYGVTFLDDDFVCPGCGVEGTQVEGEAERYVSVLKRLQNMQMRVAQVLSDTAVWKFMQSRSGQHSTFNDGDVQQFRRVQEQIQELWEEFAELADSHPDVFSLEIETSGETLEEYVLSNWNPGDHAGTSMRVPGVGAVSRCREARAMCREFEEHLDEVSSVIGEDVEERLKGRW
jgi:uncharacterized Zn finger protein (UPF0148 family)